MPRRAQSSVGSGFIVDTGYVITNAHVVDDAIRITVKLDSGEELPANVLALTRKPTLRVKVNAGRDLPFVPWAIRIRPGRRMGFGTRLAFGLSRSVTAGIISHKQRTTGGPGFSEFIQTEHARDKSR